MVKGGGAEPFAEAVVTVYFQVFICVCISTLTPFCEFLKSGVDGLDAAVKGGGVEALNGWV